MFKALLFVSSIWLVCADDMTSPYDQVGTCERAMKALDPNFEVNDIANKGNYVYVYSNSINSDVDCTTAMVDEKDGNYSGSQTSHTGDKSSTIMFTLPLNGPGFMNEDLMVGDGDQAETYHMKLYVDNYDDELGVMSYTRCSDLGKKPNFDYRSVIILAANKDNTDALNKAADFVTQGGNKGLNDNPTKVNTKCQQ